MSNLSQFAPFAGGGLKSFQTGYIQVAADGSSGEDRSYKDVTISSVNTSKTITSFQGSIAGYNYPGNGYQVYGIPAAYSGIVTSRMTSATNLRLGSVVFDGPIISGRWQVAEAN